MVKYNNSPIIEAVCEFRFGNDTIWNMTIPGILYAEIQKDFPHIQQHMLQDINLPQDTPTKGAQITTIPLTQFQSENKKRIIQVGSRILSINRLKPYDTWSEFKSTIESTFNTLGKKVELRSIQRIGLRYINRIEIPEKSAKLEDYFKFRPFLGEGLNEYPYVGFIVGCVFPFNEERDSCKVELTRVLPENSDASAFMLDIDYFLNKPHGIEVDQSLEWIERAHDKTEIFFEGCISDPLRNIFDEVI